MIKRAKLSVTRRKVKSVILLVLLFIIANLVLSSIAIKNATEESMKFARQSLGSEVTLQVDMDKIRSESEESNTDTSTDTNTDTSERRFGNMDEMRERMQGASIYLSDVEKLKSLEYVSDIKYGYSVTAEPSDFSLVETSSDDTEDNSNNFRGNFQRQNLDQLRIEAINTFDLLSSYKNGTIELVEGNSFDEEDKNPIIISYDLAAANELSVGDTMTAVSSEDDSITVTYTVVGIYQNAEDTTEGNFFNSSNQVYTNVDSALSLLSETAYNDGDYAITNPVFYLKDPENIDKFIEEGTKLLGNLDERDLKLGVNDSAYQSMIKPIEGVGSFADTVLWGVVLGSVIIISLMIINGVKDRNYEIGVLLSLGERKKKIILQFFIEALIVATLAFSLSLVTSGFVSQKLGDKILENQISSLENSNNNIPGGNRGTMFNRFNGGENSNQNVKTIDEINVNVNTNDVELLFIFGYIIIFLSMIIPSVNILRTDPKDILSRKDV